MPPDAQDIADEERGVVYGTVEDEPLLLDVFRPPARVTARPAVVLVHGGGMWTGSRADMADPARQLAQAGYIAFAVDYRLVDIASGRHPWPAQLDDVQHAVRWVRANAARYGVDPERVGAYGWSAGGQLAALLGTRDTRDAASPLAAYPSRVACVVDLAGDVDLAAYTSPPALDEVVALLGGTPAQVPERYRDTSPLSGSTRGPLPSWSSTAPWTTWSRSRSRGGWCPPSARRASRWSTWNSPTPAMAI